MRIARLQTSNGPKTVVADGDWWSVVVDPFVERLERTGESFPSEGAVLLAPIVPRSIVGIGHNLTNNDHPLPMQAWFKSVHTLAATGDEIPIRREVGAVNIEGELAAVIGKRAENLTLENALDAVLGFTVANDVTNVDQCVVDERNFQGKGGSNYTPLGPWIETDVPDPENVATTVVVNGEVKAESGSFNLPSSVAAALVYVTAWVTLYPGDVVLTGAPNTFVEVFPGDTVEIELDGIGRLTNSIV